MHVSAECWKLQRRERLCVQLGHFSRLCIAAATTGFVLIGWMNHFRVRTWPTSPYPAGADQGMEKQTGLVTHKHNQECRPAWIYYSWRMEEHGGGECWQNSHSTFTAENVCKAALFLNSLIAATMNLHLQEPTRVFNEVPSETTSSHTMHTVYLLTKVLSWAVTFLGISYVNLPVKFRQSVFEASANICST